MSERPAIEPLLQPETWQLIRQVNIGRSTELLTDGNDLYRPRRWRKPRLVTIGGDLFDLRLPNYWIYHTLAVVRRCPQHRFIAETEFPGRASQFVIPNNMEVRRAP